MKKTKIKIISVVVLLSVIFLAVVFFSNSFVRNINVTGNYYLRDEYILDLLDLDYENSFIMLFPKLKERKKSIYIESISIVKDRNRSINVKVSENSIIGYMIFPDDSSSTNYILLKDGTLTVMEPSIIKSLSNLCYIDGFDRNELEALAKNLSVIEPEIMMRVSEIKKNPFSYDSDMLKFLMDDGFTVYCEADKAAYMNSYLDIVSTHTGKFGCLLIDSYTSTALSISCDYFENMNKEERDQ